MALHSQFNGNDIEWQVFIGPPNIEYPTYSPTIKHDFFTLQPNTETFITFALEHETVFNPNNIVQKISAWRNQCLVTKMLSGQTKNKLHSKNHQYI